MMISVYVIDDEFQDKQSFFRIKGGLDQVLRMQCFG